MNRRGLTLLELLVVLVILVALAGLIVPMIGQYGSQSQGVTTWQNLCGLQELLVNRYMADMRDASGNPELPRPSAAYVTSSRPNHPQLRYLFINPDTETPFPTSTTPLSSRRWSGPYITHRGARYKVMDPTAASGATNDRYGAADVTSGTTATSGDPTVLDAFGAGQPIVIQEPAAWDNTMEPGADPKKYARLVSAGPDGVLDTPPDVGMPTVKQRNDDLILFLFVPDKYGANAPSIH